MPANIHAENIPKEGVCLSGQRVTTWTQGNKGFFIFLMLLLVTTGKVGK